MKDNQSAPKSNTTLKKIGIIFGIIAVLIAAFIFGFVILINSLTKKINDRLDNRYVMTKSEMEAYIDSNYCNATVLDSEFTYEPEPKRIITFKDDDHGFTFTATSKRGPQNQLTVIPLYSKSIETDYELRYYEWIEEQIKPLLEAEGIELYQYNSLSDKDKDYRRFSVREMSLTTSYSEETSDRDFISETLESYKLPKFLQYYEIQVTYIEDIRYELSKDTNTGNDGAYASAGDDLGNSSNENEEDDSLNGSGENLFVNGQPTISDKPVFTCGLDDVVINNFGLCAMYMPKDADIEGGRPLSSRSFDEIRDFLFYLRANRGTSGERFDPDTGFRTSFYVSTTYENWSYMLKELYGEDHPEEVKAMLDDGYNGEYSVYYNAEDDSVYAEAGAIELFDLFAKVKEVRKEDNVYTITYDVYSVFSTEAPIDTVKVIVKDCEDNLYGYKLVGIE